MRRRDKEGERRGRREGGGLLEGVGIQKSNYLELAVIPQ